MFCCVVSLFITWLPQRAGKTNQIQRCHWPPEGGKVELFTLAGLTVCLSHSASKFNPRTIQTFLIVFHPKLSIPSLEKERLVQFKFCSASLDVPLNW